MVELKSSVPGLVYPSGRNAFLGTSFGFLEGRRKDDGAEGFWRINDCLYDLEDFVKNHPGGTEWITMTKGTDITEAFEVHHLSDKAERLLPKFFVRKAVTPRSIPFTFEPNGFYRKFKMRVREALKNVDYHKPSTRSKLIADSLFLLTILSAVTVAVFKSWPLIIISGLFLTWTAVAGHNFFHMRDNFRMWYFDLSLMSSKEWRVSHGLSHHLYANTLWDMEIYVIEPFIEFLPKTGKRTIHRLFSLVVHVPLYFFTLFGNGIKRYYSSYALWKKFEVRDLVPFSIPVLMCFFASSAFEAVKLWLCIIIVSSLVFSFIGFTAAHHHPEIFHDGDVYRKDLDWALMQLDAVRDRNVVDDSLFLVLTYFGSHALHHLLPTVDHAYLELCIPAFNETCREFGVHTERLSQWELIKGQYKQMMRNEPRINYRGGQN
ncbi:cytochrome b5-related protein-like [Phymastichus coffea]|uniref:cytochrome b5-related protein-like n=1 Tax=Phymastichus coffea TaxID=108790 RepID=UPI00273AB240|nr:cytochrome b5-related protein-like [Phymastichus coffea]